MGQEYLSAHPLEEFLAIGQSLTNDDYATITYTSGTTADPKGVILTHRNYTANVEQSLTCVDIDDTWRTLVILPLDHCFAHVVGFYIFMYKGASVATTLEKMILSNRLTTGFSRNRQPRPLSSPPSPL